MTLDEKLISLDSAASNINSVLLTLDPSSNRYQALSVALEQVEWVKALFKKDDYPPTTMQVEFKHVKKTHIPIAHHAFVRKDGSCEICEERDNKTKATGEKDLPEPVICGHGFLESWNTDIVYCHLPKGHEGSHVA